MNDTANQFKQHAIDVFEAAPDLYVVFTPDLHIVDFSEGYLKSTNITRNGAVGRYIFDVFPDKSSEDPESYDSKKLLEAFDRALQTKAVVALPIIKYNIPIPENMGGGYETRYWNPLITPILDENQNVIYFLHRIEDVTNYVNLKAKGAAQDKSNAALLDDTGKMATEIYQRGQDIKLMNERLLASESAARELNARLEVEKKALQDSNKKMALLTELIETMLACKNLDEITVAISIFAKRILSFSGGIIYLMHNSRNFLEKKSILG